MIHLGDITRIHGAGAPIVEVIIGGSPCQDLSVAGKRAGLAGERSGLFMDQVRIVKEMRDYDARVNARTGVDVRPRYMVWENVPGAFSSNGGEDFRAVLEEIARVVEKDAVIPRPPNGKWQTAGCVMGDGWSIAWRVLNAQFWGVAYINGATGDVLEKGTPQRRRRIALVADFGGHTAPEILFERESVSGDSQESGAQGQGTAGDAERGVGKAVYFISPQIIKELIPPGEDESVLCMATQQGGAEIAHNLCPTITASAGMSGNNQPCICIQGNCIDRPAVDDARGNGEGKTAPTLTGDHQNRVTDYTAVCIPINTMIATRHNALGERTGLGIGKDGDAAYTISSAHEHAVCMSMQAIGEYKESEVASSCKQRDFKDATDLVCAVDCRNGTENPDTKGTLQAKSNGGMSLNLQNTVRVQNFVRRLTPLECERLQGYPDGWTDIGEWIDSKGKKHESSDGARYKALGNSIALPPWRFVLSRVNAYLKEHTMASLFDGIGGFPLIWQELNGPGKCLWASEIEEFPIAVTKRRFGDDNRRS